MLNVLALEGLPIFEQLKLEEALLRSDTQNWCLINSASQPAIVMGISSDPAKHIDKEKFCKDPIPLIRRYSGGGTVVVEETTLFITWILNHSFIDAPPFPQDVMRWSVPLVQTLFAPLNIQINENDYVVGNKKCGGNAQYFVKGRFVHHTSFLWDFSKERMDYLLLPPKTPSYRNKRTHDEFLYPLKQEFSSLPSLKSQLTSAIQKRYACSTFTLPEAQEIQKRAHRIATCYETYS